MVLSIIFSSSKGGLLAAIVGSVLFFVLSGYKQFMEKKKWLLGLIIVIILFESYALIKQQSTAQESLLTRMNIGNSSTTQERVYYWNIAAQMIKANPPRRSWFKQFRDCLCEIQTSLRRGVAICA